MSQLRIAVIDIAASLPVGDPTRKKILRALTAARVDAKKLIEGLTWKTVTTLVDEYEQNIEFDPETPWPPDRGDIGSAVRLVVEAFLYGMAEGPEYDIGIEQQRGSSMPSIYDVAKALKIRMPKPDYDWELEPGDDPADLYEFATLSNPVGDELEKLLNRSVPKLLRGNKPQWSAQELARKYNVPI